MITIKYLRKKLRGLKKDTSDALWHSRVMKRLKQNGLERVKKDPILEDATIERVAELIIKTVGEKDEEGQRVPLPKDEREQIEELTRHIFKIKFREWKGRHGTEILATAGRFLGEEELGEVRDWSISTLASIDWSQQISNEDKSRIYNLVDLVKLSTAKGMEPPKEQVRELLSTFHAQGGGAEADVQMNISPSIAKILAGLEEYNTEDLNEVYSAIKNLSIWEPTLGYMERPALKLLLHPKCSRELYLKALQSDASEDAAARLLRVEGIFEDDEVRKLIFKSLAPELFSGVLSVADQKYISEAWIAWADKDPRSALTFVQERINALRWLGVAELQTLFTCSDKEIRLEAIRLMAELQERDDGEVPRPEDISETTLLAEIRNREFMLTHFTHWAPAELELEYPKEVIEERYQQLIDSGLIREDSGMFRFAITDKGLDFLRHKGRKVMSVWGDENRAKEAPDKRKNR